MHSNSTTYRSIVWLGEQKSYRVTLLLGVAFLAVLMLAVCPFLLANDASSFGRFPDGSRIAGLNVSKLSKDEAVALCRKDLAGQAAAPLELKVDSENYVVSPAEVGLAIDYEGMVSKAYQQAWHVSLPERMIRRFLGKPRKVDAPVLLTYGKAKVGAFVLGAMPHINCKPRNAYIDVSTGSAAIISPRDGRESDPAKVLTAVHKALEGGSRTVVVPVDKRTPPEITKVDVGKFLLLNQGSHTLKLYNGENLLAQYPVAVGSPQYPTVIGQWKIVRMEKNPTWYNRGSTWADNMPPMIPPGPGNPLGPRAMTINGGGDLIHGTSDTGSIGSSASHGCVRMYVSDVTALYEQCYVGMPVYIIKASGQPNFDCSKHPFWWGKE